MMMADAPSRSPIMRRALGRLDSRGRFDPADLPALREVVEELRQSDEPLDHPATLFGLWEELDASARAALRVTAETDTSRAMDLVAHGSLWTGLVRGGWALDRYLHEQGGPGWLRRATIRWTNRLYKGPLNAWRRLVRILAQRRLEAGRAMGIRDLLAVLDRTPQWLQADFVRGVRVDPRVRGFYHDPGRNVTWAYFVGFDLMPTPRGICCVEANLQPGITEKRSAVLTENHIVLGVLNAARDHGVKRVQWVEGRALPLRDWMLQDLYELFTGAGIDLEVLEDPTSPVRGSTPPGVPIPRRWSLPGWIPDDTLVVRRNDFPVGPDFVFNHKGLFTRAAGRILEERNEHRVYIPPMTRVPTEVPEPQGPGFPNLVYKFPESLQGRGVFFLKARDTEHAVALARELDRKHGEPPGLFQPFAVSILPNGRRIFGFRFEVLMSPLGSWYLASYLRAGARPFPEEVPYGVVPSKKIFVADPAVGSDFEIVEPEMEREYGEAALAVADAFKEALERAFETRPS